MWSHWRWIQECEQSCWLCGLMESRRWCEELHQRSGWMCVQLLMSRRSFLYCNPAVSEDRCDVYHLNGCVRMRSWGRRAGVHVPGWHYSLHFSLLCAWPLRVSCLYKSLHCSAFFLKMWFLVSSSSLAQSISLLWTSWQSPANEVMITFSSPRYSCLSLKRPL